MLRTVIEVNGNTAFKPFPTSVAGRRSIPLPGWVIPYVDHLRLWPMPPSAPLFANEVAAPLRRSLFRTLVWWTLDDPAGEDPDDDPPRAPVPV